MKKIVCWIAALLTAFCAVGCTETVDYKHKAGAPDYSQAEGELIFDSWIAPFANETEFKDYADCGYNMMHLGITSVSIGGSLTVEKERQIMESNFSLAQKNGIRVIFSVNANNSNQLIATPLKYLETRIGTVLDKWKDTETFYGYMPYDEPRFDQALEEGDLDKMQKGYDACVDYIRDEYLYFSEHYPGKAFEIVLLRSANVGENMNYGKSFNGDFEKYIGSFTDNVLKYMPYNERIISFDAYPFSKDRDGNIFVRGCLVSSLETYGYKSEELGAEKWTYIQNHTNVHNTASVLYQYYSAMAYGYTHFVTYCYREDWDNEVFSVSKSGEKTENWYYFRDAHNELKSLENVYMQFVDGWQGAVAFDGTARENRDRNWKDCKKLLESYDGIKNVTSTEDTLIGIFRDKKGYDGYMITNQCNATGNLRNTVEATFNGATHALVYVDGKAGEAVTLDGGRLTLDLKAGGGAFVIPYTEA